jgi:hypothetical protein
MLMLDFSSLFIQAAFGLRKRGLIYSKDHLRSTFLSRLFAINRRFSKYGKLHIFTDSGKYWRAEIFAGYKKKRAERRLQDGVDWDTLRGLQEAIIDEMRENLPFAVVRIDAMEADDLIALACRFYAQANKRHLIISSDKDLTQLLRASNISQWSVGKRSFLQFDPHAFKAQLLRGDSSDSVPSIYCGEGYLIKSSGRRKLTDARLKDVDISTLESFRAYYKNDSELERITENYNRNRALIDLRCIPRRFLPTFHKAIKTARKTAELSALNAERYLEKHNLLKKFQAIGEQSRPPNAPPHRFAPPKKADQNNRENPPQPRDQRANTDRRNFRKKRGVEQKASVPPPDRGD